MDASTTPIKSKLNSVASYKPSRTVYEYKVIQEEFMKMNDLTKMGNDGWIFNHVFTANDKNQYLFYREKQ